MDSAYATDITLTVNGEPRAARVDNRMSVLDLLRERLGLTGSKKGCDHGQCGACTVLADGRRIVACLALAVSYDGASLTTIEGLEDHPLQRAFVEHDAFQCGYCTPGQIMSAVGYLAEGGSGDADAIREGMSGNLCRCAAYVNIVAAIRAVGESLDAAPGSEPDVT